MKNCLCESVCCQYIISFNCCNYEGFCDFQLPRDSRKSMGVYKYTLPIDTSVKDKL